MNNLSSKHKKHYNELLYTILIMICFFLCGCEKQICSYCGQEKYCDEYDILGVTRYICDDCLGNPLSSLSGNVISDYESELVDPTLYTATAIEAYNAIVGISQNTAAQSQVSSNMPPSDSIAEINEDIPSSDSSSINVSSLSDNTSQAQSSPSQSKDTVISNVAAKLSNHNMYLMPIDEAPDRYALYLNDSYTDIDFDFSASSNEKAKLTISKNGNATDTNFTTACIDASLAFIGNDDYSGTGFDIYNTSNQYGNYTFSGCRFYYTISSDIEIKEGGPLVTYEISFQ